MDRDSAQGQDSLIGTVLGGRFRVMELLGAGAIGEVYLAEHQLIKRPYAIKILHEAVKDDPRLVERFRREARAAGHLDHPNVVSIIDFGQTDEGRLYLVMEHISGQSLEDAMKQASPGRLPVRRSLDILAQICDAVYEAHRAGIVHRDLKPANILLSDRHAGRDHIKILDFGFAKLMTQNEFTALTRQGEVCGTPAYMSPEQARGDEVDHRADLYAIGIMAYEMLAGRLPFIQQSLPRLLVAHQTEIPRPPSEHIPSGGELIPLAVEELVLRCLEKDPARRPEQAVELRDVCEAQLRARGPRPSRVIPTVAADQVAATVAGGAGSEAGVLMPTLVADPAASAAPTPVESPPALLASGLYDKEEGRSPEWYWVKAVKKAQSIVRTLEARNLGGAELTQLVGQIDNLEEQSISFETEIALETARIGEIGARNHEAEARLRSAVLDLGMERGRLLQRGTAREITSDLDFQISTLEKRLDEVHREFESQRFSLEEAIARLQGQLSECQQQRAQAEVMLLNALYRLRPAPCPTDLSVEYDRLAALLRALQAASPAAG